MAERTWQDMLKDWLHEGIVEVTFTKVSGEERWMRCTLSPLVLKQVVGEPDESKKKKAPSVFHCTVWDIETGDWRSFRLDSVIKVVYNHEEITGQCVITNNLTLVPIHNV